MYYLGIDHHKRFSQVAVMDEKGKIRINSSMVNEKASFESLKEILKEPCKIVVEAGRNWGVMYDFLEELGIETVVAHPLKVRAIAEAKIKFDSYCSLIPSTFASGGKLYHGDLIPTGNHWLKYVFIEASWVAIRTSPYCRAYFDRIKRGKGPNVAIVALARRLSEIAYRCLKGERYYVEHPYIPYTRQTPCGCPPKFLASQGL